MRRSHDVRRQELLARQPTAGGKIKFAIVGDADAGVVGRVALRDDDETASRIRSSGCA
jgi:hypothetical protein